MNRKEYLLNCLSEEASERIKDVCELKPKEEILLVARDTS